MEIKEFFFYIYIVYIYLIATIKKPSPRLSFAIFFLTAVLEAAAAMFSFFYCHTIYIERPAMFFGICVSIIILVDYQIWIS
jgi:hypothetical protein